MEDKILVFDIETPNKRNDKISSIGLTFIEQNRIVDNQYFIINPECEFDSFNIELTGITPSDAELAPSFPYVWEKYRDCFKESLVVAHNAMFDMCVLRKTLQAYGLECFPILYLDTLEISRHVVPIEHHKLKNVCEYYGIELDAHNAMSDSNGCATVLLNFIASGVDLDEYIKQFDLSIVPESHCKINNIHFSNTSQSLKNLTGILEGVTCDSNLSESEVMYLRQWLSDNTNLKGNYPYDKVYRIIEDALQDGILEQQELDDMLSIFKNISDPINSASSSCSVCTDIDYTNKNICLSGEFEYGSKKDVEDFLSLKGAVILSNVNKKTDILLVGNKGSDAWVAGSYGTKVKKALELQEKGSSIVILKESDIFGA